MKFFILSFAFVFINFTFFSQAGPLVGQIVINKGDMKVKWEQEVAYEFKVKNAGKAPLNIIKIIGSCDCQTLDPTNIQTIAAGKEGIIRVTVKIEKTQLGTQVINGAIKYDKSVIVVTNGKKEKYQLYTRGNFIITN